MKKTLILKFVLLGIMVFTSNQVNAWSAPSVAPTGGNSTGPFNQSSTAQSKLGGLILNSGGATYGLLVPAGRVGFGTPTPIDIFEVASVQTPVIQKPCTTSCTGDLTVYGPLTTGFHGYAFTPNKNGQITELHLKAPLVSSPVLYTVTLSNASTGAILATSGLYSSNSWQTATITPVDVIAGTQYLVTVSRYGSSGPGTGYGSYYNQAFPLGTYGDIQIDYGTNQEVKSYTTIYGLVDVTFIPSQSYKTLFIVKNTGAVGINTASPASNLSVFGGIQIGSDLGTCTSAKAGTLRWQSGVVQVCNGSLWAGI